jgi:hypothetical protein
LNKTTTGSYKTARITGSETVPIPSTAGAGAFNVTITGPTASGFISAHPNNTTYTSSNKPNFSNLNFSRNQEIANAATVKLRNGAALFNGSSGSSVLLADVAGWFNRVNGTAGAELEGAFNPVDPARLMDTRWGTGVPKAKVPAKGKVTLTVAGHGGVPAALAGAAVLNVTVTNAGASGFVTAYPAGLSTEVADNTSTVNFRAGQTIPNLATVKLSSDGKVSFYNGSTEPVDVIADVAGWYRNTQRADVPAGVLNLAKWKVTLPVDMDGSGNADEVKQPALATFEDSFSFFDVNGTNSGVVFRANTGGATTSGSEYPRSELREMEGESGTTEAGWSSDNGKTHSMTITQSITHLPDVKPQVVAGQIHNGSRDIIVVRIERKLNGSLRLFVKAGNTDEGTLDTDYQLGAPFKVEFKATAAGIAISYWKTPAASTPTATVTRDETGSGWFFKAGCYTQSNTSTEGGNPDAYGEVVIRDLEVSHQ